MSNSDKEGENNKGYDETMDYLVYLSKGQVFLRQN